MVVAVTVSGSCLKSNRPSHHKANGLYAIYLYRYGVVGTRLADHEHDLQLQSREVVSKRLPRRTVRRVPADRGGIA